MGMILWIFCRVAIFITISIKELSGLLELSKKLSSSIPRTESLKKNKLRKNSLLEAQQTKEIFSY